MYVDFWVSLYELVTRCNSSYFRKSLILLAFRTLLLLILAVRLFGELKREGGVGEFETVKEIFSILYF